MRVRAALLVLWPLLAPSGARADLHKEEFLVAGSYVNQSSLFGFYLSEAGSLGKHGPPTQGSSPSGAHPAAAAKYTHPWSRVLEVGAQFAGDDDRVYTLMGGIRRSFVVRAAPGQTGLASTVQVAFVQVVAGAVRRSDLGIQETEAAAAVGIGWDFMLPARRRAGLRIQADAVFPGFDRVFPRVSVGFVWRWPHGKSP